MSQVEPLPSVGYGPRSPVLESGEAICLFAFAERAGALGRLPPDGAPEHRLALHLVGSVAALIGIVPIEEYCGVDAERHLTDVAWLAPRVRRHAEVVEWAMQGSPVFPAPFGTLYMSVNSLSAFMRAHETTIADFLHKVADKEEWELRAGVQFDSPEILDELACSAWPEWREMSKGARYLRLCRDRNALLEFGRAEAVALVSDLVAELQPLTAAIRRHDLGRRSDSSAAEPVARWALLVPKSAVATLRERVRVAAVCASRRHVAVALSGPWPPFSFRPDLNAPN
ncbi:GvpL/GvpF family gas vesicle protein [Methylocapsa polymorpha]|uniref:GvpL/GvpF family gas vesicle protein n=1 Tax=Methylocapsa polymorpha TaxID=3080828 RepID=A0ABZ0HMJ2_9HYPH|nr:GvpL/GvpF family gas vesicle protein [Methylocapsa sp. RX1]